jgi:hypothetical protein
MCADKDARASVTRGAGIRFLSTKKLQTIVVFVFALPGMADAKMRTFLVELRMCALSAMCEFNRSQISLVQRMAGSTGRTAA